MLQLSIGFFFVAVVALLSGLLNLAGVSFESGRILFFLFASLSALAFLATLDRRSAKQRPKHDSHRH